MKTITLLMITLLLSSSVYADTINWICQNPEGEILSIEAKETEFTPFIKVTSKHHTISGFAQVLEKEGQQRWSLIFNTSIALYMDFINNETKVFWKLSNSMNYSCDKEK